SVMSEGFVAGLLIGRIFDGAADRAVWLGENRSSGTQASRRLRTPAHCRLTARAGIRSDALRPKFVCRDQGSDLADVLCRDTCQTYLRQSAAERDFPDGHLLLSSL